FRFNASSISAFQAVQKSYRNIGGECGVSSIRKLDPKVAGKIAAGEIIERPASVVKELIENSLDASSSRIAVEISDGGKTMIRIEDNGDGIQSDELHLAVQNFSTSKIHEVDDISNILTLGFRGEALASIRSVSQLTIRSMAKGENVGREMQWRGEKLIKDSPYVRNPGTEIIVNNLFFNFPARKKFMASGSSELRRITSLIQSFALAFPETSYSLRNNDREILVYPASSLKARVEVVFGSGVLAHLEPFENRSGSLCLHGFTSMPNITRGNRSLQFLFVNRRHIKDRLLTHAIHQAYHSLIPRDRFPLVVLFLEIAPDEIDVNVHPAKTEIRFKNDREIHGLVSSTLRKALKAESFSFKEKVESVYRNIFPQKITEDSGAPGDVIRLPTYENAEGERVITGTGGNHLGGIFHEAPLSLFGNNFEGRIASGGNLYWQLHQSFILIQIRGGMVIVDQHAAHERILFNKAKNHLGGNKAPVQSLLFPATLELTPEEYERYEELSDILPSLGFEVKPFGMRSIIVQGIPAGVRNWNDGYLLQEILGDKDAGRTSIEQFLKTYACHSAIKAGTKLSTKEMESLTDQLFATEFPFTCPHGRPTMLRVDLGELEKRFHRTVSSEN
ncbi:MAG: DNA mismatch repair endonuclease MutL, partial [Candidatus Krumholzibacteria bacterium]|nr:DNA mismatch repair endonuclease MutL [Candidatus Krumholzibacteria bacterium]